MTDQAPSAAAETAPAPPGPPAAGAAGAEEPRIPAVPGTVPPPGQAAPAAGTGNGGPAPRVPPGPGVNGAWWLVAVLLLAAAVVLSFLVARGTAFTNGHRASAAADALLVVAALAVWAHLIVAWYQAQMASASQLTPPQATLAYRRRGLKAAVIGQDGRASTSKTQVVLWTAAVVWALVDLLLLARAYPGGNLFTTAVTGNWRPEYLVLLGLPVVAATTAKAVVAGSNAGHGPIATSSAATAAALDLDRVYLRDPSPAGVWGFFAGVAELLTGDDGAVSWADLQYVVFTLITLVYFAAQLLSRPQDGLPPVPAALLTLTGVSATAYTANKIVNTQGVAT